MPALKQEESLLAIPFDTIEEKKTKVEEMSMAGVGNALAANLISDGGKAVLNLFTKEENKPITKGDLTRAMNTVMANQNRILRMLEKKDQTFYLGDLSQ